MKMKPNSRQKKIWIPCCPCYIYPMLMLFLSATIHFCQSLVFVMVFIIFFLFKWESEEVLTTASVSRFMWDSQWVIFLAFSIKRSIWKPLAQTMHHMNLKLSVLKFRLFPPILSAFTNIIQHQLSPAIWPSY